MSGVGYEGGGVGHHAGDGGNSYTRRPLNKRPRDLRGGITCAERGGDKSSLWVKQVAEDELEKLLLHPALVQALLAEKLDAQALAESHGVGRLDAGQLRDGVSDNVAAGHP